MKTPAEFAEQISAISDAGLTDHEVKLLTAAVGARDAGHAAVRAPLVATLQKIRDCVNPHSYRGGNDHYVWALDALKRFRAWAVDALAESERLR